MSKLLGQFMKFLFDFLIFRGPEVKDYLRAMNSESFRRRTGEFAIVYDSAEERFQNSRISILYYRSQYAETVDLFLFGERGGLVFTVRDGVIISLTKDGTHFIKPTLSEGRNFALFQILQKVRTIGDSIS